MDYSKPVETATTRGLVTADITVATGHIAIYNNMEVPDARTVEVEGLLIDPGWS